MSGKTNLYSSPDLKPIKYEVNTGDEKNIVGTLDGRDDAEANRIKRYLNMADLSRTSGSP